MDGQVSGKSCTYGYDLTDRLCEAVFDDGTAYRYTYDVNDCLVVYDTLKLPEKSVKIP